MAASPLADMGRFNLALLGVALIVAAPFLLIGVICGLIAIGIFCLAVALAKRPIQPWGL
ncbi:hypothetical protein [Hypericibacter sp.]|uniref:hypothetical protein n=1 Tax=Hypericibacter sp. TaxID=2705401 RepID=UPI003D6D7E06